MLVCFNVFIIGNIIYMLILVFDFASKLCLIVMYPPGIHFYQINSISQIPWKRIWC